MATIPSKQLHRADTLAGLQLNLSNREIGYCTGDGLCYIKFDGVLVPIGTPVVAGDGISVTSTGNQTVVSLGERNTYTPTIGTVVKGAIGITAGTVGDTQNKVSLGNVTDIGALTPIPASGSKGKVLMVTGTGGELG